MKTLLIVVSVFMLASTLTVVAAQQGAPQPDPSARTFEGSLSKVDTAAKTLTVKAGDNREMVFTYDDQTQVTGADDGVQGLTGKTGSSLKVSYREQRGTSYATKIEIQPKK